MAGEGISRVGSLAQIDNNLHETNKIDSLSDSISNISSSIVSNTQKFGRSESFQSFSDFTTTTTEAYLTVKNTPQVARAGRFAGFVSAAGAIVNTIKQFGHELRSGDSEHAGTLRTIGKGTAAVAAGTALGASSVAVYGSIATAAAIVAPVALVPAIAVIGTGGIIVGGTLAAGEIGGQIIDKVIAGTRALPSGISWLRAQIGI